jgi:hypothetical protein
MTGAVKELLASFADFSARGEKATKRRRGLDFLEAGTVGYVAGSAVDC